MQSCGELWSGILRGGEAENLRPAQRADPRPKIKGYSRGTMGLPMLQVSVRADIVWRLAPIGIYKFRDV